MKIKTSVSLSAELLHQITFYAEDRERSIFIEKAVQNYLTQLGRYERNQLDLEKINDAAAFLNGEAADTLLYQIL